MGMAGKTGARALVRRGSRSDRSPRVAALTASLGGPTVCDRCGAVYERKTWRAGPRSARTLLTGVRWVTCPACKQIKEGEYFGRVIIRGTQALAHETEILGRVRNVATRATFTQPERRLVSIEHVPGAIEVLTTSQKLAHRMARELEKAFGGDAKYKWDASDGSLRAEWTWSGLRGAEREPKRAATARVQRPAEVPAAPPPAPAVPQPLDKLELQTRGVELDPRWRDLIEDSTRRLLERYPGLLRVHATLRRATHEGSKRAGVAITAQARGRALRVEKKLPRMMASIHAAFDTLERELGILAEERSPVRGTGARVQGSVRRIFRDAGYGFIRIERGQDIYFHRNALRSLHFATLKPGDPVELEIEQAAEGPQASSVFAARSKRRP